MTLESVAQFRSLRPSTAVARVVSGQWTGCLRCLRPGTSGSRIAIVLRTRLVICTSFILIIIASYFTWTRFTTGGPNDLDALDVTDVSGVEKTTAPAADGEGLDSTWWDPVAGTRVGLFNLAHTQASQVAEAPMLDALGYLQGYEPARDSVGVVVHDQDRAQPGYNLYVSAHAPEVHLMSMQGEPVHTWRLTFEEACPDQATADSLGQRWFRRALLLPDGELLVIFNYAALLKIDVNSNPRWIRCGSYHHDMEVDEDGRIYTLTVENGSMARSDGTHSVFVDWIEILDSEGRTIERISLLDAVRDSPYAWLLERVTQRDALHTNTITIPPDRAATRSGVIQPGHVLLSFRNVDAVAALDLESRKISWAMVGPWRGQHEPVLLEDGGLLVFDNLGPGEQSRIVEIDLATEAPGWSSESEIAGGFFSPVCGSNQRLANGNTLVTESTAGRAFEVTRDKTIVWDFRSPHRIDSDAGALVAMLGEMTRVDAREADPWLRLRSQAESPGEGAH